MNINRLLKCFAIALVTAIFCNLNTCYAQVPKTRVFNTEQEARAAQEKDLQEQNERTKKYGVTLTQALEIVKDDKLYKNDESLPPVNTEMQVLNAIFEQMLRVKPLNLVVDYSRKAIDEEKIQVGQPIILFSAYDTARAKSAKLEGGTIYVTREFIVGHRKDCNKVFTYTLATFIMEQGKPDIYKLDEDRIEQEKLNMKEMKTIADLPKIKLEAGSRLYEIAKMVVETGNKNLVKPTK